MSLYLSLAWRNLWRNKRRSLISVASILFAVIIALIMRSLQLGMYGRMIDNMVSFYTGYAQIQAKPFWDSHSLDDSFLLTDSLQYTVSNQKLVSGWAPRLESFGLLSGGEVTDGALILGVDPEREAKLTNLQRRVTDGRYLAPDDRGILLAGELARHLQLKVGDTVVVLSQGYHGVTAAGAYPVIGILSFPSPDLDARLSYLPLALAQQLFGADDRATSIALMVREPDQMPPLVTDLRVRLGGGFAVLSWKDMLPEMVQFIALDNASGIIMLGIIYLVIGFGILGTILMMTMERQREFGMLISIGMKRARLRMVVVIESLLLSLTGVVTGIIVGLPLLIYLHFHPIRFGGEEAKWMMKFGLEPIMAFSLNPTIFTSQAQAVLVIALIAALYPLWRIGKIRPAAAQRMG